MRHILAFKCMKVLQLDHGGGAPGKAGMAGQIAAWRVVADQCVLLHRYSDRRNSA